MFEKRFAEAMLVIAGTIGGANEGRAEQLNAYEPVTTRSLCEELGGKARMVMDGRCELLDGKNRSKQSSEFAGKAMDATKTFVQGRKGQTVECTIPSPDSNALCQLVTNPPKLESNCEMEVIVENDRLVEARAVCKY